MVLPCFVWKRLILIPPHLFFDTRYSYRILVASLTKLESAGLLQCGNRYEATSSRCLCIEYTMHYLSTVQWKSEKMTEKSKRSKLLGEDTINLKISELLSSSSEIVWTSTHTIRDRT